MAASDCSVISIEVKERVITVLFSSAAGSLMQCDAIFSIGVPVPQVIAKVCQLEFRFQIFGRLQNLRSVARSG